VDRGDWKTQTMPGNENLEGLLAALTPMRVAGEFVMVCVEDPTLDTEIWAMVREDEGVTYVLERSEADRLGLSYDLVMAWITLGVTSDLGAVGLTHAVSGALARAGISCNVEAGYHHDHLLVPIDRATEALDVLRALAREEAAGPVDGR
jgi:uncharacterized protein